MSAQASTATLRAGSSETCFAVKVCHLSTIPSLTARTFYRQCLHLAKSGHDVSLICPSGKTGFVHNVKLVSYSSAKGAWGRLLSTPLALGPALREQADIYHLTTLQMIPAGLVLKLLFRKHVVYDIFEDFPTMALTKQYLPQLLRKALAGLIWAVESLSCRLFDGIVTADPAVLRRYCAAAGGERIVFYNLPSPAMFPQNGSAKADKRYDIVYSGGLSERTGMFVLADAVRHLVSAGISPRILLFGYADSPQFLDRFKQRITELEIAQCFEIRGRVSPPEVPLLLQQARIGVVPLQAIPKFLRNLPTKLFEYWACGLATVASDLPPIRPFFQGEKFGFVVDPTKPAALAGALSWLLTHPEETRVMGARAQTAFLKRLNCDREITRLSHFYRRVLAN